MTLAWLRAPTVLGVALGTMASVLTLFPPAAATEPDGACRSGFVSLTFDDGPARPTHRLVRFLRSADVPATFFMVGQRVDAMPWLAREVEQAGFLIANHSHAHVNMTSQTSAEVAATLRAAHASLRRAGTHPTRLMRPPYGALDAAARDGIRAAGYVPVLWTIDPRDWESATAGQIAMRILTGLRPHATNIVLQHDGVRRSPTSVDAVRLVINGARRRGYCFVALDERGRPGFPTPRATVSVTDTREGAPAVATVRLSQPPGRATSVLLRTRSRSATVGDDLEEIVTRVTIPAGELALRVRIPVRRDGIDEPRERFEVSIGQPQGLRIGDDSALAEIRDIDPQPRISGVDSTVTEPTPAAASVGVRLQLSQVSGRRIDVVVATRPGTADGTDFTPARIEAMILPGQQSLLVPIEVLADAVAEPDETFTVEVIRAEHLRIGRPATVTIAGSPSPG